MDLSVIIVNYNVRHFLEQCLHSVKRAASGISCEIFVVDNNSADGSCSMVTQNFPEVILIMNKANVGFSAACNQAIKNSSGRFILLLNPDTVIEEDTFNRCIRFMDSNPDAGALGVKMLNGNGKLLPESKRAFPKPAAAFFKMVGLTKIFPKSRYFNRYYLGHLDSSKTTEAEIISGAFMFIRKEALMKTGLLDESFFMYGEDIDLSYRLMNAGYKNYYYPEVKIIHYKGESTKKGDVNYIIHFYRAMLIFISKHMKDDGFGFLKLIIRFTIFFWGFASLLKSTARKYLLPISDAFLIVLIFMVLIPVWGDIKFGGTYRYPEIFSILLIPSFCIVSLVSIFLANGYRIPSRVFNVIKGLFTGTTIILVFYSLLPQNLRFSRAVILLGGLASMIVIPLFRLLIAVAGSGISENPFARARRMVIVGNKEGYLGIISLIKGSKMKSEILGRVSMKPDDLTDEVLGNVDQLGEIIRVNRIREVVFASRELSVSEIINLMQYLSEKNIIIRIAPAGEKVMIGSKSLSLHREFL